MNTEYKIILLELNKIIKDENDKIDKILNINNLKTIDINLAKISFSLMMMNEIIDYVNKLNKYYENIKNNEDVEQ